MPLSPLTRRCPALWPGVGAGGAGCSALRYAGTFCPSKSCYLCFVPPPLNYRLTAQSLPALSAAPLPSLTSPLFHFNVSPFFVPCYTVLVLMGLCLPWMTHLLSTVSLCPAWPQGDLHSCCAPSSPWQGENPGSRMGNMFTLWWQRAVCIS